ncbi:MAG TPA: hypothetical protein VGM14_03035 [Streptosporangiaceae bacterium]
MGHVGGVAVGAIVVLVIVLSLGRSIRRASRMNPNSPGYVPPEPGAENRDHGGGQPHGGHGHHGGHAGGGHAGGGHTGGGGAVGGHHG